MGEPDGVYGFYWIHPRSYVNYNVLFFEEGRVGHYELMWRKDRRPNRKNKLVRGLQRHSKDFIFEPLGIEAEIVFQLTSKQMRSSKSSFLSSHKEPDK